MIKGYINKIIPFSAVDGPGNRTAIFLQGCNFNCIYCHNPETINYCNGCGQCVEVCPIQVLQVESRSIYWDENQCTACDACIKKCNNNSSPKVLTLTAEQILEGIAPYQAFINGITVSGGECTLQEAFLIDLFKQAKARGLSCYIDTNGSKDFEKMQELLNLTDGVMLDVKVWDEGVHQTYIGTSNQMVIKNLKYLKEQGKLYEVRTVVVPELFDNEETVREVSRIIGDTAITYKLIKFRKHGVREEAKQITSPTTKMMEALQEIALSQAYGEVLIV